MGQWFLCYILPSIQQLNVIKIDFTHSSNIKFGTSKRISAKDAISISVSYTYVTKLTVKVAKETVHYTKDWDYCNCL